MTIKKLIDFINHHTNNDVTYSNEPWGKDVSKNISCACGAASHDRIEEVIKLIRSFSGRDWLALRTDLNLKEKSNFWVECLIYLLDEAYTEEARQMIIYIALNGTEDNFFDAMKYIQSFRRDVSIYTWLKLKNRASEISRSN
ncbi:MAG: hypothetical protein AAF383_13890 [Cyanobacteria bacterium P01_A01_bin.83]